MNKIVIEGIDYTSNNKLVFSNNKEKQLCYEAILDVLDNNKFKNIIKKDVKEIIEFIYNNNL